MRFVIIRHLDFVDLTEVLVQTLEILKSRLNVLNADVRKNSFGPDYMIILERTRDAKLFRAAVRVLRDWVNMPKAEEHFAPATREKVAFLLRLWNAYPRWSEHPEVAREILDCIYQVGNGSLSNDVLLVELLYAHMVSTLIDLHKCEQQVIRAVL